MTVYLTLTLAVLLSLTLALIEGARNSTCRLEVECITDVAMNSVLAEYHRELFDRFDIFAVDTAYGTGSGGRAKVEEHLAHYAERNLFGEWMDLPAELIAGGGLSRDLTGLELADCTVTRALLLTDGNGSVFRRKAAESAADTYGLTAVAKVMDTLGVLTDEGLFDMDLDLWRAETNDALQEYDGLEIGLSETGKKVVLDDPTSAVDRLRGKGILNLVMENTDDLSQKTVNTGNLVGSRLRAGEVFRGNMPIPSAVTGERLLFLAYLYRNFDCYGDATEDHALNYQLEYLIGGKNSDAENLKSVALRLSALREAANAAYLLADGEKHAAVSAMAAGLSAVILLPQLQPLFETGILLAWAYAESLYDVKVLLSGGSVPLWKDTATWHYSLENALKGEDVDPAQGSVRGLAYREYLEILTAVSDTELLTMRAMDLAEADIRLTKGNENFCMDACYTALEAELNYSSSFGYRYSITRTKTYS